jgi:hypothetical protein
MRDGWLGLSLSRTTDVDLLPVLIEGPVGSEPWASVADWAAHASTAEAIHRTAMLGLAASAIPGQPATPTRPGVVLTGRRRRLPRGDRIRVVDLTALWAGPLCANLLARSGAEVVTVESPTRPDGARSGNPDFYALLHRGHELRVVDFYDQTQLRRLIHSADVVLESSRPRALRQLGIDARETVAGGTIWLSITAYGRNNPMRIGFGDDIAAGAGLVAWDAGIPCPAGDAIADPIAGVSAAAAVLDAIAAEEACLIDVSMHDLCAEAASADAAAPGRVVSTVDGWAVDADGRVEPVAAPRLRSSS